MAESKKQKKVLVYWTDEKRWSTVSESAVRCKDHDVSPGTRAMTKFQGKYFPAIIIAKEEQNVLDALEEDFKAFLNDCLMEEAGEDIEKCVVEYAKVKKPTQATEPDMLKPTQAAEPDSLKEPIQAVEPDMLELTRAAVPEVLKPAQAAEPDSLKKPIQAAEPDSLKKPTETAEYPNYLKRKESSSEKRMRKLEEEVRSLRKKVKKIEEKMEEKTEEKLENTFVEKLETHCHLVSDPVCNDDDDTKIKTGGIDEKKITFDEQKIAKCKTDHDKFRYLCQELFTTEELINSSRTGKRSIHSKEKPRPALNQAKLVQLQDAVNKYCAFDNSTFVKKFENFQKILRKKQN